MSRYVPVAVTVHLDPMMALLLRALMTHTGHTQDEVIAEGLRCLFAMIPRPDDTAALERDHVSEASKPGGRP